MTILRLQAYGSSETDAVTPDFFRIIFGCQEFDVRPAAHYYDKIIVSVKTTESADLGERVWESMSWLDEDEATYLALALLQAVKANKDRR